MNVMLHVVGRELTLRRSINKLSNSGNIGDTVNVSFSNKERVIPLTKCSVGKKTCTLFSLLSLSLSLSISLSLSLSLSHYLSVYIYISLTRT